MELVIRTWNLYHGRTHPKTGRTYLERMVRLISLDAPDVVALQEVPLWALGRLERWSGMRAIWSVTVPGFLGPVARFITDLDPVRVRFTAAGVVPQHIGVPGLRLGDIIRIGQVEPFDP